VVVNTIVRCEIPAKDIRKLRAFYRRCFGWKFENAKMPGTEYR
jgi:predicted enzyme related to lactoylglutathione lyase